jgi:hypothetical protein
LGTAHPVTFSEPFAAGLWPESTCSQSGMNWIPS